MFNLQNVLSKIGLFSRQINNVIYRPLSTSNVVLHSIRDKQRLGIKVNKISTDLDGTSGSESWISVDTSKVDEFLPGPEILKTSFDGMLYEDLPIVFIKASRNNTLISVTDCKYNLITYTSCRLEGFKNAKKKSTIAGQSTGEAAGQRLRRRGIITVRVVVKGVGPGRMSSVRGIANTGVNVVSITDRTPLKELGPRPRKIRRV